MASAPSLRSLAHWLVCSAALVPTSMPMRILVVHTFESPSAPAGVGNWIQNGALLCIRALFILCLQQLLFSTACSLQAAGHMEAAEAAGAAEQKEDLEHVGLVVWQSAFLLAELLTRRPPWGTWGDVRVVDLGTGTGGRQTLKWGS